MVDVEFRIVSDRREGVLLQLGRAVAAHGFILQRPRMMRSNTGVVLTVIARGPEAKLLALQDKLGSHPFVVSFEASNPGQTLGDSAPQHTASPEAPHPRVPTPGAAQEIGSAMADKAQIESLLSSLVSAYPKVIDHVLAFERTLASSQRDATLTHIGSRLGAWIYKRDFALGGRLALADSLKQIALPGMRRLLKGVELQGDLLRVADSPFCGFVTARATSCQFLVGTLHGLLSEPAHMGRVRVVEATCRNAGADICTFSATV